MGGDTGGNDCVHVIDVRATDGETVARVSALARATSPAGTGLRLDTDVVIHDEHGNVCQFTYAEWRDFLVSLELGEFRRIGAGERDAPHIADGAHADYLADPDEDRGCSTCESSDGCAECRV